MHYKRLKIAYHKAMKTFRKYHRHSPDDIPSGPDDCNWVGGEENTKRLMGVYRKTKVFCSDPFCCGNPRRAKGNNGKTMTIQERKANNINEEWE